MEDNASIFNTQMEECFILESMNLLTAFLIALGINIVMFIPAYVWKTDKLTDISYAVTFMVVAGMGLLLGGITVPSLLLVGAIFLWALRLGGYLLTRIRKIGKDSRFDEMRSSLFLFGRFWILQGLSVWVIMVPSIFFLAKAPETVPMWSFVGLFVWASGLIIEGMADVQKYRFINNPQNTGKWIDQGLWKYSRHPNYFGEICVWIGLYIFTVGNLASMEMLFGLVSPLYITFLLLFGSGIPILEKSADKKWGKNAEYQKYKKRTSILIPLP